MMGSGGEGKRGELEIQLDIVFDWEEGRGEILTERIDQFTFKTLEEKQIPPTLEERQISPFPSPPLPSPPQKNE